jgi:hypothetical protein
MTSLSLQRLSLRPAGTSRVRHFFSAWSALVARSFEASQAYDRAPTTSARHKVLAQFADSGA